MHRQRLAIKVISLILLFVMAIGLTPAEGLASPQAADNQPEAPAITFEEAIPTPENVLSQYCNNATTIRACPSSVTIASSSPRC